MTPSGQRLGGMGGILAFLAAVLLSALPAAAQETSLDVVLRPQARPATLPSVPPLLSAPSPAPAAVPEGQDELDIASASPASAVPGLGPETNLPLPRFVSLKTGEGNARRGPSLSHRIDWVFVREDMPLMITAEYGHWRRVVDREGLGGWVHYSLLSGSRTVVIDQNRLAIRTRPDPAAPEVALLEQGVIAHLGRCEPEWCRLAAGGFRGWAPKAGLWGVGAEEILE